MLDRPIRAIAGASAGSDNALTAMCTINLKQIQPMTDYTIQPLR